MGWTPDRIRRVLVLSSVLVSDGAASASVDMKSFVTEEEDCSDDDLTMLGPVLRVVAEKDETSGILDAIAIRVMAAIVVDEILIDTLFYKIFYQRTSLLQIYSFYCSTE